MSFYQSMTSSGGSYMKIGNKKPKTMRYLSSRHATGNRKKVKERGLDFLEKDGKLQYFRRYPKTKKQKKSKNKKKKGKTNRRTNRKTRRNRSRGGAKASTLQKQLLKTAYYKNYEDYYGHPRIIRPEPRRPNANDHGIHNQYKKVVRSTAQPTTARPLAARTTAAQPTEAQLTAQGIPLTERAKDQISREYAGEAQAAYEPPLQRWMYEAGRSSAKPSGSAEPQSAGLAPPLFISDYMNKLLKPPSSSRGGGEQ